MPSHIVCPSGLAGEVRGLTGKEGKLLADRSLARSGATIDRILGSCWLQTTDAGIYELADGANPDWSKVLVGDRFYALVQIRRASFGDTVRTGGYLACAARSSNARACESSVIPPCMPLRRGGNADVLPVRLHAWGSASHGKPDVDNVESRL